MSNGRFFSALEKAVPNKKRLMNQIYHYHFGWWLKPPDFSTLNDDEMGKVIAALSPNIGAIELSLSLWMHKTVTRYVLSDLFTENVEKFWDKLLESWHSSSDHPVVIKLPNEENIRRIVRDSGAVFAFRVEREWDMLLKRDPVYNLYFENDTDKIKATLMYGDYILFDNA